MSNGFDLGPFRVVGRLGEGAMGVVHNAVHRRSGTPAAIKVVSRKSMASLLGCR